MRRLLRALLRLLFRYRAYNESVLKTPGPVLLIPNHLSWIDWLLVGVCLDEDWRFVTSSVTAQFSWVHRLIMVNRFAFPIDTASPYAVRHVAEYLQGGGRLVLFAEGRLSHTGTLMKLFDGTGFLLHKSNAKVITAYLRGADRLSWVRHHGWTRLFPRLSVHFSELLSPPKDKYPSTSEAREQLTRWLRERMVNQQFRVETDYGPSTVLDAVAAIARMLPRKIIMEDASRRELTYRRLMVGANLLAKCWQDILTADSKCVGVLLPNVNATPVVLLSLWAAGLCPAILNYSVGTSTMLACAKLAGFKQIITSRLFLDRAKLDAKPFTESGIEVIYLEDVREGIAGAKKMLALIRQLLWPGFAQAKCRCATANPQSTAVILFTSGSEGVPKGVELTHSNLITNLRQMLAVVDITDGDRMFNALPIFHSFGLTIGTLLPLVRGLYVFIYPSPLHYRMVPAAVYDRNCTIFLSTNTFLNGYARKANPYDFRSVRYLFAGAEKLQETTTGAWSSRFGVRIFEGYGATECSPCLCVNTPFGHRPGSVGRFLPGIEHRLEPVEGVADGGRLFVRGPNVMKGYLNPDANATFKALDGWYDTGDIVRVDAEGFVHILGRLKRFAKVSGEMVSLTAVEEALAGAFPHYGLRCQAAVLSRPDEEKGETLVVVTNEPRLRMDEVRSVIRAKGFSNLCVPRQIIAVREIPKLGTGKVNHRELAQLLAETA